MPNFLRFLLFAFTILSLLTARWAYVRGQARQERTVAVRAVLMATSGAGPQWLPGANWQSWPVPAAYHTQRQVVANAAISAL